ncbi:MAG: hypothetical protein COA44_10650 [Arcobacter sp.]|nr:MAG: hypothetical protein COA44_10650 [Arcobacter sp.]
MKLAKMSLVAAMLLGANLYAIDNVKVNGDVKVNYHTEDNDAAGKADIFDKDASYADTALHLGLTADLSEGVSAGISATAVSSLGLENNLVSNVWSGAHTSTANADTDLGVQVDDAMWIDEMWIAGTAYDTTVKLGRQALDTPLAFTETWGIDTNTFEAAVIINQSIADTTLVATYIGKSNGSASETATFNATNLDLGNAGYVAVDGKFNSFYDGVYAFGAINNSWKPLTAQAWYYDLQSLAKAYWLQADLNMEGILVGAQYTQIDVDTTGAKKDKAYAVMLGYALKDVVTIKAAYSSVDDEGALGLSNTATANGAASQTKLYTEMWWNYGQVASTGADSFSISAEGTVAEIDLFAAFYSSEIDTAATNDTSVDEIALTATKSYGPLDTTLAIIYDDIDTENAASNKVTTLQVYLTYNF